MRTLTAFTAAVALGAAMLLTQCDSDGGVDLDTVTGAAVNFLITPQRASGMPSPIGAEFDVAPSGNVIIGASGQLVMLEADGDDVTLEKVGTAAPDSFAFDANGVLLTIVGQFFGELEDQGPTNALPLPAAGMRLAPSSIPGKVLLFGGPDDTKNRLYAINDDGTMDILVELPEPIVAASDNDDAVYVATAKAIYRAGISRVSGQNDIELVIGLPEAVGAIRSISAAKDDHVIFFATDDRVYALHGLAALAVVRNAGGLIRFRSNALFLWDSQRKLMVKLTIPGITDQ